jgi:hypothetical protein
MLFGRFNFTGASNNAVPAISAGEASLDATFAAPSASVFNP